MEYAIITIIILAITHPYGFTGVVMDLTWN